VPGSRSIKDPHLKLLKSRAQAKKRGLSRYWMMSLQKKIVLFCDGEVFSLDRGLLMGAMIYNRKIIEIFADFLWKS